MGVDEHTGGYSADKRWIEGKIGDLSGEIHDLRDSVDELKLEVRTLKTKASVWGGIVGAVVGIAAKYLLG